MKNDKHKYSGLGSLKARLRWGKPKVNTKVRSIPTLLQSQLFNELQSLVNQQQQQTLTFDTRCQCKVCNSPQEQQPLKQDLYMASSPTAYLNLFTLLQHLTMVQADQAPAVLGSLQIPMLFFKRQSNAHKQPRSLSHNKSKDCIIPTQIQNQQQPNFILFKSNQKTCQLEYPTYLQSLQKVSKLMKLQQQYSRRRQQEQYKNKMINLGKSSQFTGMTRTENIIHKKFFNEAIPSYKFTSSQTQALKSATEKFIIHEEDRYISQQIQSHKMKQSQPFCVFRYMGEQGDKSTSKYEIFTMQALENYQKNQKYLPQSAHKKNEQNLHLLYIQSFTKIKSKPIVPKKIIQGILSLVGLAPAQQVQQLEMVYYSQYSADNAQIKKCELYNLAKLQVNIRSGRMSHIDPSYLDIPSLQSLVADTLELRLGHTTSRFKRQVKYRTYKIVHVLEIVCRIIVSSLRLKWLLDEHEDMVLVECIQYEINIQKSLKPKKSKDAHVQHIINNGLEFLNDNGSYQDMQNIGRSHPNIQHIVQSRIQQRQQQLNKHKQTDLQCNVEVGPLNKTHKVHLRKLSKSMEIHPNNNNKVSSHLQPLHRIFKNNRKPIRTQSIPQTIMEYAHSFDLHNALKYSKNNNINSNINNQIGNYKRLINNSKNQQIIGNWNNSCDVKLAEWSTSNTEYLRQIKQIRTKYSLTRKTYKLKPFKTQSRHHSPQTMTEN